MPRKLEDQILLRLPDGWRQALKDAAARNDRSMNSELLHRLRPTIEADLEPEAR